MVRIGSVLPLLAAVLVFSCVVVGQLAQALPQMQHAAAPSQPMLASTQLHPITRLHVLNAQRKLNALGYDAGIPDGKMGAKTRNAIAQFERDRGLPVTGEVSHQLIAALRHGGDSGKAQAYSPMAPSPPANATDGARAVVEDATPVSDPLFQELIALAWIEGQIEMDRDISPVSDGFVAYYVSRDDCRGAMQAIESRPALKAYADAWLPRLRDKAKGAGRELIGRVFRLPHNTRFPEDYDAEIGGFLTKHTMGLAFPTSNQPIYVGTKFVLDRSGCFISSTNRDSIARRMGNSYPLVFRFPRPRVDELATPHPTRDKYFISVPADVARKITSEVSDRKVRLLIDLRIEGLRFSNNAVIAEATLVRVALADRKSKVFHVTKRADDLRPVNAPREEEPATNYKQAEELTRQHARVTALSTNCRDENGMFVFGVGGWQNKVRSAEESGVLPAESASKLEQIYSQVFNDTRNELTGSGERKCAMTPRDGQEQRAQLEDQLSAIGKKLAMVQSQKPAQLAKANTANAKLPTVPAPSTYDFDIGMIGHLGARERIAAYYDDCESNTPMKEIYHCSCLAETLTEGIFSGEIPLHSSLKSIRLSVVKRITPEKHCVDDHGAFSYALQSCLSTNRTRSFANVKGYCQCAAGNFSGHFKKAPRPDYDYISAAMIKAYRQCSQYR